MAVERSLGIGLLVSLLGCTPEPEVVDVTDAGPPEPVVEYVRHQEILTPLPLRVQLPARYGVEHVLVFVKTWGSRDWALVELARNGQTWTGEVSCRAVSTVTGDTRYYFLGLDAAGVAVVGSGSPEWPHVATIVRDLGGAQSLSGDFPPMRCHDPADCPPDFAGCPAYAVLRPGCRDDFDCAIGSSCEWDGYCGAAPEPEHDIEEYDEEELLARAVNRATARFRTAARSRRE